jgi:hypothetical protein
MKEPAMLKSIATIAVLVALAPLAASAAPAAVDPGAVTVTLSPNALTVGPRTLTAGTHTLVVRNRGARGREFELVLVPGGIASLTRFEGLLFLPEPSRLVRSFGLVRPRSEARATLSLRRGDYVLVARSASVVVAAAELRVR